VLIWPIALARVRITSGPATIQVLRFPISISFSGNCSRVPHPCELTVRASVTGRLTHLLQRWSGFRWDLRRARRRDPHFVEMSECPSNSLDLSTCSAFLRERVHEFLPRARFYQLAAAMSLRRDIVRGFGLSPLRFPISIASPVHTSLAWRAPKYRERKHPRMSHMPCLRPLSSLDPPNAFSLASEYKTSFAPARGSRRRPASETYRLSDEDDGGTPGHIPVDYQDLHQPLGIPYFCLTRASSLGRRKLQPPHRHARSVTISGATTHITLPAPGRMGRADFRCPSRRRPFRPRDGVDAPDHDVRGRSHLQHLSPFVL